MQTASKKRDQLESHMHSLKAGNVSSDTELSHMEHTCRSQQSSLVQRRHALVQELQQVDTQLVQLEQQLQDITSQRATGHAALTEQKERTQQAYASECKRLFVLGEQQGAILNLQKFMGHVHMAVMGGETGTYVYASICMSAYVHGHMYWSIIGT